MSDATEELNRIDEKTKLNQAMRDRDFSLQYAGSIHKANGNDIQRIENKLDKILIILEKL